MIAMENVIYLEEVDSTNDYLKRRCSELESGTSVTAKIQTAGKGRRGHSWTSCDEMLPMSILFKNPIDIGTLTARVGLGVCEAIEKYPGLDTPAMLKWPNDVIMENHKVCGILCESLRDGACTDVICGIGINISQTAEYFREAGLPNAASIMMISGTAPDKNELFDLVAENVKQRVSMPFSRCIEDYRSRIVNIGKQVRLIENNTEITAFAEDISNEGYLICRDKNNMLFEVSSGEVSVRGLDGYV